MRLDENSKSWQLDGQSEGNEWCDFCLSRKSGAEVGFGRSSVAERLTAYRDGVVALAR